MLSGFGDEGLRLLRRVAQLGTETPGNFLIVHQGAPPDNIGASPVDFDLHHGLLSTNQGSQLGVDRVQLPESTQWETDSFVADRPFPHMGLGVVDVRRGELHHTGRGVREERLRRQELAHLLAQVSPGVDVGEEILDAQLLDKRFDLLLDGQVALEFVLALLCAMLASAQGFHGQGHLLPNRVDLLQSVLVCQPVAQAGKIPCGHSPMPKAIGSFQTGGPEQLLDGVRARPQPMVHLVLQLGLREVVEFPLCTIGPGTPFQIGKLARLVAHMPWGC